MFFLQYKLAVKTHHHVLCLCQEPSNKTCCTYCSVECKVSNHGLLTFGVCRQELDRAFKAKYWLLKSLPAHSHAHLLMPDPILRWRLIAVVPWHMQPLTVSPRST